MFGRSRLFEARRKAKIAKMIADNPLLQLDIAKRDAAVQRFAAAQARRATTAGLRQAREMSDA